MNQTSDICELNVEEIDLVSGGATVQAGPITISASKGALSFDFGGLFGFGLYSGSGAEIYAGECGAAVNRTGAHAGC